MTLLSNAAHQQVKGLSVRLDSAVFLAFFLAGFALCHTAGSRINATVITKVSDVWFDADASHYNTEMSDRLAPQDHANVHPLASVIMSSPVFVLKKVLHLSPNGAVRALMSVVAGVWLALLYLLFRTIGCRPLDSAVLGVLASTCSAAMFLFPVPETHPFASLNVVFSLLFAAWSRRRRRADGWYIVQNLISASITTTNWMYGLFTSFFAKGWKRCVQITVNVFAVLTILAVAQKVAFPPAPLFFTISKEEVAAKAPSPAKIARVAAAFFFHSVTMPSLRSVDHFFQEIPVDSEQWPYRALSVQQSLPGSGSVWGMIAVASWGILLILGFLSWKAMPRDELTLMMACVLIFQLGLHCIYGSETFLYSLSWLPLLLAFVALAVTTRMRLWVLGIAICLIAANTANNAGRFQEAAEMLNHPERYPSLAGVSAGNTSLGGSAGKVDVLTSQYDNARTGANLAEMTLNTANVNVHQFGKLFQRQVDGMIYAQPLYAAGVDIPGAGKRNVIYVATMHNTVYAFDADGLMSPRPYWRVSLGDSLPFKGNGNIEKEVGILSTPVIDRSTSTLYVAALRFEGKLPTLELHALDLTNGKEKFEGPVAIHASVPGKAPDAEEGRVPLRVNPVLQLQRTALLLANNTVYVGLGGSGDVDPYHGWLIGYQADHLQRQVAVFNASPDGARSAIWQSGEGPAADGEGNVYITTANGDVDGVRNFGTSFLKLSAGLTVADWFTPENSKQLNDLDWDLGTSSPILIPGTNLLAGGSKVGVLYVLNRSGFGHSQPLQSFQATRPCQSPCDDVFEQGAGINRMAYWSRPSGSMLYVWGWNDVLRAYRLEHGEFETKPASVGAIPANFPGGMMTVSANASREGTGIVWATTTVKSSLRGTMRGTLRAFEAGNVSHELWNSDQEADRDFLGNFAKFSPPIVANGKVYVATFSNRLVVYGLY